MKNPNLYIYQTKFDIIQMSMQYKINKSYIFSHYLKIFIFLKFYVDFLQKLRKIEKVYNFDLDGERIVLDDEEKPNRQTNNNTISSRVFLHVKGSGVFYTPVARQYSIRAEIG